MYLPIDELKDGPRNLDLAADYIELNAFFSYDSKTLTSGISANIEIGAPESSDQDLVMQENEDLVCGIVDKIGTRRNTLADAYPFDIDSNGDVVTCNLDESSFEQTAYVLSLLLSNLPSLSPILTGTRLLPKDVEVRKMREYFQYFATVALAVEIQGDAWSFGSPRPDSTPFLYKLREIWQVIGDGSVKRQVGAPTRPQDDGIDVIAARCRPDRLPGIPIATAQVATGKDAREKSLLGTLCRFKSRWFSPQPVTIFIPYMIVPFACDDDTFIDDVRSFGNVLHRMRVPHRVKDASRLVNAGVTVEGYDQLTSALQWVSAYRSRCRATQ